MISKYFEKYCSFYLSKYWVNQKKFENILKSKITKDFFQKKISFEEKESYLNEIKIVLDFYSEQGFFDEEKLIQIKIDNLRQRGFSFKKMRMYLKKNFFNENLINEQLHLLENKDEIQNELIKKYLSKSGLYKEIEININKKEYIQKILRKLFQQGFEYNECIKYLKETYNLYDYN